MIIATTAEFTSKKLRWLTAVCFDRRVTDTAKVVAFVIANHLNAKTGRAFLSDDTIALEIGSRWPRRIGRARKLLRENGWLKWQRTSTASFLEPDYSNVAQTLDVIESLRERKRNETGQIRRRIGHQRPISPDRTKTADVIGHQSPTNLSENSLQEESLPRESMTLKRVSVGRQTAANVVDFTPGVTSRKT